MANYLVTGGAGFIGSNIVEALLERGDAVRVLDDFSTGLRANVESFLDRIDLVEGSICDAETTARAVADMDFVLHQAAVPSVPRSVEDPIESLSVGVMGTAHLLNAARQAGVRRFVYAASSSAYGDQPEDFKHEGLLPQPLSPYAGGKLSGELLCSIFHHCYGLNTISLRYFNVFGPRQDPGSPYSAVVPRFITAILEGGRPTFYGDGRQTRDFTYVRNNVEANLLAASCEGGAGQVVNVACGGSYSLHELLAAINKALGTDVEPIYEPARVGDVRDSKADIARARECIGYEPMVSFEEGIRLTVEWYRARA